MKQKIYNELIVLCKKKIETSQKPEKFEKILKIIQTEDAFERMTFDISMNILLDLGFSNNDALEVYKKLIA